MNLTKQEAKLRLAELLARRRVRQRVRHLEELVGSPSRIDLLRVASVFTRDASEATRALVGDDGGPEVAAEYEVVEREYQRRLAGSELSFPAHWAVDRATAEWLYRLVRVTRPEVLLEVGVANGASTFVILEALERNGAGRLVSVDVAEDVGVVVGAHDRWTLEVIPEEGSWNHLARVAERLRPIDVFFHDARHDFVSQTRDYDAALPHIRSGGLFLSDDVDWSYAFLQACRRLPGRPVWVVENHKVAGGIRVP